MKHIGLLLSFSLFATPAIAQDSRSEFATSSSMPPSSQENGSPHGEFHKLLPEEKLVDEKGRPYLIKGPDGDPNYAERQFEMPPGEALKRCLYAPSYSFPFRCVDNKGEIIFDAEQDSQEVLDKIIMKQGKKGKYNKLPGGKPYKLAPNDIDAPIPDPKAK